VLSDRQVYNRSVLWCVIGVGEARCAVVSVHLDIDINIDILYLQLG
jgi:endonuclease/exonuclease/phosphatase family metal-dependent hydrolase